MIIGSLRRLLTRHSGAVRISVLCLAAACVPVSANAFSQSPVHFNKAWWDSLDKDEHWDFVYGFTDCGKAIQSGLNMAQYEDFISEHVSSDLNSVPKLILLAPHKVEALPQTSGGEVWTGPHSFNNSDLWSDWRDGRVWVEGYLACEHRPAYVTTVDRYVQTMLRHYADPKRHLDNLADVLEPLLPPRKPGSRQ